MILDLGPASVQEIKEALEMCKTVVWNGPLGRVRNTAFRPRDKRSGNRRRRSYEARKILSVAGGGDTVSALAHAGVTHG